MLGQLSIFGDSQIIKDSECTINTPVRLGVKDAAIYGTNYIITPAIPGRCETPFQNKMYLPELLPLEEYDKIIILFSGGKDSTACYFKLIEMGVPKEKIELWHHDIDGGHPTRRMDWPCTVNYVKAFAEATETQLRLSWRQNGFWGEVYRVGSSHPIQYMDNGEVKTCKLSKLQERSQELRESILNSEELKEYGYRMKFPAKSADLNVRWCSAYLKIVVGDTVIRNLEQFNELRDLGSNRHKFPAKSGCHQGRWCSGSLKASVQDSVTSHVGEIKQNSKILIISGERRGESVGRSKYNEMEIHRTNALAKAKRLVHWWRPVIDYSERDIWEVLKRNNCNPHPCYRAGWNRCSCMMCIFSLPKHWAGIRELFPHHYEEVRQDEKILGFTLDNTKTLDEYVGNAESCLRTDDEEAIYQLKTGEFRTDELFVREGEWKYPVGAFGGSEGGPC
jgi:3'-phosphoadenosine 5'-phosphosulfate sulfotransferase (PAPS reductase)/FAD synthetase